MSSHLGPIHYKMFERILATQALGNRILRDQPHILQTLDQHLAPIDGSQPLDALIDQANIHGWLQACVDRVEARLAFAAQQTPDAADLFYQAGYETRQAQLAAGASENFATAREVFLAINDLLLDGMPCDGALAAQMDEDGSVYLIQRLDVHEPFWNNPLEINPDDSLDNTCEGKHEHHHDHNDEQIVHLEAAGEEELAALKESAKGQLKLKPFQLMRYYWLNGFLHGSSCGVKALGATDLMIYRREEH